MKAIRIKILILSAILLFVSLSASAYQVRVMVEPERTKDIYKTVKTRECKKERLLGICRI